MAGLGRQIAAAGIAATAGRVLLTSLRALPRESTAWADRRNHRGATVSLVAGPIVATAGALGGALTAHRGRLRAAACVAGLGAGAVGVYDDVVGARPAQRLDKGFAGHLQALRSGRVSAGLVKVAGIGITGLAAAALVERRPRDVLIGGAMIAGTANLVNLFDLRPGRAAKVSMLLGAPLLSGPGGPLAAGAIGATAAVIRDDLAEKVMLGDAGANAIGAILGLSLLQRLGFRGRLVALAGIASLTAASERVSFSALIDRTPLLRSLDRLGRSDEESTSR